MARPAGAALSALTVLSFVSEYPRRRGGSTQGSRRGQAEQRWSKYRQTWCIFWPHLPMGFAAALNSLIVCRLVASLPRERGEDAASPHPLTREARIKVDRMK